MAFTRDIYRIADVDFEEVRETQYDAALFASGSEPRCTHVPQQIERNRIRLPVVIGYDHDLDDERRSRHDQYYMGDWQSEALLQGPHDGKGVYECLRNVRPCPGRSLRVLVDYSSMARLWYSAVLNWAVYTQCESDIVVDFVYAVGKHKQEVPQLVISQILAIPGCEESPVSFRSSVVVFGLGFDGPAALCVLDKLEPHEVYAYMASPAAYADYPERTKRHNSELIKRHASATLELPLTRVEYVFRALTELISPHRGSAAVLLVPMGPKPHVLAAILLAMRFRGVSCLDVIGRRERPERVGTTGEVVATRVEFKGGRPDQDKK